MASAQRPRVALVTKRSSFRMFVEEGQDPRIASLAAKKDESVKLMRAAHEAHESTIQEVEEALAEAGAEVTERRSAGEIFDPKGLALVVTVGGDGTLLSASHQLDDVPILGINSAPEYSVGFFCGAKSGEVRKALAQLKAGKMRRTVLSRMKVSVNGEVVAGRVLNEALFCHPSPAATSRYILTVRDVVEPQKSSGFWIGPAAGSTAAQRSAGGRVLPLTSKQLQIVVREPYTPHDESYALRRALIPPGEVVTVRSKMKEARLFFDGPNKVLPISFADVIEFTQADRPLTVLGISSRRKWGASGSS